MKKLEKILLSSGMLQFVLTSPVMATETASAGGIDITKIALMLVAGILVVLILYMSYKSDSPSQIKRRNKTTKSMDRMQKDLSEKDTTYEVEEDEFYADDKIDPISIADDEDEISLFESVNNPDTEKIPEFNKVQKEEIIDLSDLGIKEPIEEVKPKEDLGGTMVFNSNELNNKMTSEDEFVAVFLSDSSSEEPEEIIEEVLQPSNDVVEVRKELDIFAQDTEDFEEEEEPVKDSFENSLEEPEEEFLGFTTIAPKKARRGSNKKVEEVQETKEEEKVEKEDVEDAADDFLAQMAKNLGGEEIEKPAKKTATKTTTKKATEKKETTKKAATKTTAAKKTTTKKTTSSKTTKK